MTNLLKANGYHILGLDISASQKDILKRSKDLMKFIQIEEIPEYDLDLGVFGNFRTEDSVKDAVQKLSSPKKQIKDYFFWFNISDNIDEQALEMLRKKDISEAIKIWEQNSQDDSTKSMFYKKNLAILYCIFLFKENNDIYLNKSLKIWHELVNSTKFWGSFSKIYKLNDELNTNQETIDEFQKNSTSYVSDLYTELAESQKDNKYVAQFSSVFNTKGEKTSKSLLTPIFDEMTKAVEQLESLNVTEDGVLDKDEATEIKKNVSIIQDCCNKLLELGLYDDSHSKIVRERAATALRSLSIDLNNNIDETSVALGLIKIADQISGTEGFKNKLQEDIRQIQENEDYKSFSEKSKKIIDPIIKDFANGNTEKALNKINELIYKEDTEEALKNELREMKELIEKRMLEHGKPGSPTMFTIWTIGTRLYGDTLYFVALFIPIFPISRWSCREEGNGSWTFYGKLELTENQKIWRVVGIIATIIIIILLVS